jgi:hypothetical protein
MNEVNMDASDKILGFYDDLENIAKLKEDELKKTAEKSISTSRAIAASFTARSAILECLRKKAVRHTGRYSNRTAVVFTGYGRKGNPTFKRNFK